MAAAPAASIFEQRVAALRRFNRGYTSRIGVLQETLLESAFSLTEARVLYELANRTRPTAAELCRELALDAGYLSRILRAFEQSGLITRTRCDTDGRQHHLALTPAGQQAFAPLDRRSRDAAAATLDRLAEPEQARFIAATQTIERLIAASSAPVPPVLLRPHRPGDMGWVVSRHGALYAEEYGWDIAFEALVAEIVAAFIQNFDGKRERCFIAEVDGEPAGSAFVVKQSDEVAKLRLLLVEPKARGLGIGARLVGESVRFARHAGYRKITLWTQSILVAARSLYEHAGFRLVHQEPHHSFGHDLVGENWEIQMTEDRGGQMRTDEG